MIMNTSETKTWIFLLITGAIPTATFLSLGFQGKDPVSELAREIQQVLLREKSKKV